MNALELLLMRTSWIGFLLEAKQIFVCISFTHRLPWWFHGKEPACNVFNPWVGKIPWRRAWQPTPGFLPGEFHGQRSLLCHNLWSHKQSDTTEHRTYTHSLYAYSKKFGFIVRVYGEGNGFLQWLCWERICLPMQETWVRFLGQEDPLEKEMATGSSMAWRSPWTEEPGRFSVHGIARVGHDLATKPNQEVWTGSGNLSICLKALSRLLKTLLFLLMTADA